MIKKIPDTLVIVLFILFLFIFLTWIIPAGEFARETIAGRDVIVPGSYQKAPGNPQGFFDFLQSPIRGFISSAQIIAFVFIVGGSFAILNKTGAINAGLHHIIQFSIDHPSYKKFIIPLIMVLFSLAGATFGMSEEVLVFVLITLPLSYAMGYDAIVGVAIPFVGAGVGFAGAFSNPFTIGIAQGIAELPPFSGWQYRIFVWAVFTTIAILFVMRYANKISKNKQVSYYFDAHSQEAEDKNLIIDSIPLNTTRKVVLLLFFFSIALLIYGVNFWDWYINEIAGLFFGMALLSALFARLNLTDTTAAFTEGAKDMMTAGLVIALSKGILIIASDGKIIDTILYHVADLAGDFPKVISVQIMFLVQSFLNFFLPSGSGQAALTMPIMAPLSDLLGITRQTAVLAFQFGDGLSNMIIPTSGVTMGVLAIAKVPYQQWVKWMLPLMAIFFIVAMLLLIPPVVLFYWGPF